MSYAQLVDCEEQGCLFISTVLQSLVQLNSNTPEPDNLGLQVYLDVLEQVWDWTLQESGSSGVRPSTSGDENAYLGLLTGTEAVLSKVGEVQILFLVSHGLTGWMESRLPNLKCWMTGNFSRHCERMTEKEFASINQLYSKRIDLLAFKMSNATLSKQNKTIYRGYIPTYTTIFYVFERRCSLRLQLFDPKQTYFYNLKQLFLV